MLVKKDGFLWWRLEGFQGSKSQAKKPESQLPKGAGKLGIPAFQGFFGIPASFRQRVDTTVRAQMVTDAQRLDARFDKSMQRG